MIIGFLLAWFLPPWLTVVVALSLELWIGYSIRDNFTLNVINLITNSTSSRTGKLVFSDSAKRFQKRKTGSDCSLPAYESSWDHFLFFFTFPADGVEALFLRLAASGSIAADQRRHRNVR